MHRTTRRSVLGALGIAAAGSLAGGVAARSNGTLDRLLSTGSPVPENLGFDDDGTLYVGITGGSVRRVDAEQTDETDLSIEDTTEAASYPGGVAGVTVADGTLYTAVNGDSGGVFELDLDGTGGPAELATLLPDGNGFVNDLFVDGDRLLVTESFGGTVYEVPRDGSEPRVWVEDPLLDTSSFGANGVTRLGDTVYVSVTRAGDAGRIVAIPVADDGAAGDPETFVEDASLFGADGLTKRGSQLYVAVNAQNRITRVSPNGSLTTVVESGPLSFPSEVVFDPTARGRGFVCNFSPSAPEAAGVLRTHP